MDLSVANRWLRSVLLGAAAMHCGFAAGQAQTIAPYSGLIARNADGRLLVAAGANIRQELGAIGRIAPVLTFHHAQDERDATYSSAAFCLLRFTAPDTLDDSFGTGGAVLTPLLPRKNRDLAEATALVLDPSGRAVVVGWRTKSYWLDSNVDVLTILRHSRSGAIDPSFGDHGIVTLRFDDAGVTRGYAAAADRDGRLLVAAYNGGRRTRSRLGSFDEWSVRIVVLRFTARGERDDTFGTHGAVVQTLDDGGRDGRSGRDFLRDAYKGIGMTLAADGAALVAATDSGGKLHLMRFDSDGRLDTRFGTGGSTQTALAARSSISTLLRDPAGRLLAVGTSEDSIAVLRYRADGSIDSGFADGGLRKTALPAGLVANAALLDAGGRLLVAASGKQAAVLVRYDENGSADESFASDGLVNLELDVPVATRSGLTLDRDGAPVVAVYSAMDWGLHGVGLVRYSGASTASIQFRSTESFAPLTCGSPLEFPD